MLLVFVFAISCCTVMCYGRWCCHNYINNPWTLYAFMAFNRT